MPTGREYLPPETGNLVLKSVVTGRPMESTTGGGSGKGRFESRTPRRRLAEASDRTWV